MLETHDLTKMYGDLYALNRLNLTLDQGDVYGFIGPNGAGKTTTMRAIAGVIRPTRGRITVGGHDVVTDPVAAKSALAYVADDPGLFESLTVWEHLQFVASAYRVKPWKGKAESLLARLDLEGKRDALAGELSRGMRQKVAIACGYLHDPGAILLDEPLTGLDPRGIRTMRDSIRDRAGAGAAVLVSSHLLSLVEGLCTSVLVLQRGRVVHHGAIDALPLRSLDGGRPETLEEFFLRLTDPDRQADGGRASDTASVEGAV